MGEKARLTPRVWLGYLDASIDATTDTVNSRIDPEDSTRFTGGIGVDVSPNVVPEGKKSRLSLRGSAGVE